MAAVVDALHDPGPLVHIQAPPPTFPLLLLQDQVKSIIMLHELMLETMLTCMHCKSVVTNHVVSYLLLSDSGSTALRLSR